MEFEIVQLPDTRIYFYIIYFFHFTLLEFLRFYKRCDLNLQKKVLIQIFSLLESLTYFSSLSIDL